ncbi:MAG TPA: hypothetical protein VME86_00795 [Acidobacteriaceae bacterium]|nr:hypothetical protein [Acidobacteriaceae bacterium]
MNLRIGLYCLLGGVCFTISALGTGHFWLWWLCGVLTVASLAPVARFGPRHPLALMGAIYLTLLVVGLVCTLSEGVLFFPGMKAEILRDLMGGATASLITAAVLVGMAKVLKLTDPGSQAVEHHSVGIAIPMVLLAGLSYVAYYQVFGYLAYHYFTQQYYPQAAALVGRLGLWFYAYQLARGTLMVLAVLPIVYTLRLPRWQAAIAVGILMWIVGGGAALLLPNTMMVAAQRYEHIVEIMTQNVSLGITALLLLRPRAVKSAA